MYSLNLYSVICYLEVQNIFELFLFLVQVLLMKINISWWQVSLFTVYYHIKWNWWLSS
jgi:hypothetical protein